MNKDELIKLTNDTLLFVEDKNLDTLLNEINTSIELLNSLESLDLKNYEPILTSCNNVNRLREDFATSENYEVDVVLKNAELQEGDFIKVLKTV